MLFSGFIDNMRNKEDQNRDGKAVSFSRYGWILFPAALVYLIWELYWANKVGYTVIKWHTHLAVYFYLWLFLYLLLYALNRAFHFTSYLKFQLLAASACFTLLAAETVLYVSGTGATYTEKLKYGYTSPYSTTFETPYRTRTPNDTFYFVRPEFKHFRRTNSLGFCDREWPLAKGTKTKRILCLGDSFTEGLGTEQDSTYVSALGNILQITDSGCYVMNGGTASDDPFVNFINYRDRLAVYQPDIIIQTLSTNDILTDITLRGGMERFTADGKVKYKPAPWWEPVYALSYISRLFFTVSGYNELLLSNADTDNFKKEIDQAVVTLFKSYAALAQKNNCRLLLVLQPYSGNINEGKYDYDFSHITNELKNTPNLFIYDLLPYYTATLKTRNEPVSICYWKQDGHHNAAGYALMAEAVKSALDSFQLIRSEPKSN